MDPRKRRIVGGILLIVGLFLGMVVWNATFEDRQNRKTAERTSSAGQSEFDLRAHAPGDVYYCSSSRYPGAHKCGWLPPKKAEEQRAHDIERLRQEAKRWDDR